MSVLDLHGPSKHLTYTMALAKGLPLVCCTNKTLCALAEAKAQSVKMKYKITFLTNLESLIY
jgi:hypothetical protein